MLEKVFRITAFYIPTSTMKKLFYRLSGIPIGKGTIIGKRVLLRKNVNIGENVKIGSDVDVLESEIGNDVTLDRNVIVHFSKIGDGSIIKIGSILKGNQDNTLVMGKNVLVEYYWILDGIGGLTIQDSVILGGNGGSLFTHSGLRNRLLGNSFRLIENLEKKPILLESNSVIGPKVTVQMGVRIAHHSAVMANSSVIKDVEPYTMVGGVPAKPIKRIEIRDDKVSFVSID